jgi:type VI secretion system protein ImpC
MNAPLSTEVVDRAIAEIDLEIAAVVDAVLHDPQLQALEAAWRGLAYVVGRVDFRENIEVVVWSYSKEELDVDFADGADVTQTRFFRTVYSAEYGQHGGRPYGLILADWEASAEGPKVDLLRRVASVAAMAHAPVLLAAAPDLLRLRGMPELQAMRNPEAIADSPALARWSAFRSAEDSRYVGVLLPRVLMRLPYREMTRGASRFVYEEDIRGPESYLWGSPIFPFAVRVAGSFSRFRSYAGVLGTDGDPPPVLDWHPALGAAYVKPAVEVVLSRRLEQSLSDLGFIPLSWDPVQSMVRFHSACSVQAPRTFGSGEAGQAATISHLLGTRLPYLLLACRFAHYLKVLERERIGMHRESAEIEKDLNDWLSQYVVTMDSASPAVRLKYPLRNARVKVTRIEGNAGLHRIDVLLQPHLRYMRQAVTLSLTGRMEAS